MTPFHLTVSSPDGNLFDGEVVQFTVRGTEGELAILAGHVPFITSVVKGKCDLWSDEDTKQEAFSDGGLLCVSKDGATFISGSFRFL
jgi:F-type H+-transporting ATPase subunit epsilon